MVQEWDIKIEKRRWSGFRRGRGVTYLRLQGWGPSLPFFSQDSRVYFQIHCHGCSSPPGGPPLTNQLPAHLPAGQRPSVAHRWSLPLPAHRGQDQSREIYPALYQDRFTGGSLGAISSQRRPRSSLFGWPHYFSQRAVTSRRLKTRGHPTNSIFQIWTERPLRCEPPKPCVSLSLISILICLSHSKAGSFGNNTLKPWAKPLQSHH